MNKDTKFIVGSVLFALLFSSIPLIMLSATGNTQSDQLSGLSNDSRVFIFMMLGRLSYSSGSLFVSVLGLALSLYYRQQNPGKFRLTLIFFSILLANTIAWPLISTWLDITYLQQGASLVQRAADYAIVNSISSIIYITSWIILWYSIFSRNFDLNNATPSHSGSLRE